MSWRDADAPPPEPDGWRSLGWSCAALGCAGILSAVALPGTEPTAYGHHVASDFFRPQWWVLASLAAYPLFLAARSSWRVAVPLTAIIVAQMFYIVHTAVAAMAAANIATDADRLWFVAWAVQSLALAGAGAAGARISLRDRRRERRMRRAVGVPSVRDADAADAADDGPGWRERHYRAG
jgi:hypothetical protein